MLMMGPMVMIVQEDILDQFVNFKIPGSVVNMTVGKGVVGIL